ncbi:unnamed protein product [Brassica napus]|nr:unnamed protein product [Brassica napus]
MLGRGLSVDCPCTDPSALPPNGLSQRHVPLGAKLLLGVGNRAAGACVASSRILT